MLNSRVHLIPRNGDTVASKTLYFARYWETTYAIDSNCSEFFLFSLREPPRWEVSLVPFHLKKNLVFLTGVRFLSHRDKEVSVYHEYIHNTEQWPFMPCLPLPLSLTLSQSWQIESNFRGKIDNQSPGFWINDSFTHSHCLAINRHFQLCFWCNVCLMS